MISAEGKASCAATLRMVTRLARLPGLQVLDSPFSGHPVFHPLLAVDPLARVFLRVEDTSARSEGSTARPSASSPRVNRRSSIRLGSACSTGPSRRFLFFATNQHPGCKNLGAIWAQNIAWGGKIRGWLGCKGSGISET